MSFEKKQTQKEGCTILHRHETQVDRNQTSGSVVKVTIKEFRKQADFTLCSGHQLFPSWCKSNTQVWLGKTRFHDHIKRVLFEKWLVNKWISNVPPNAVAVFNNILH